LRENRERNLFRSKKDRGFANSTEKATKLKKDVRKNPLSLPLNPSPGNILPVHRNVVVNAMQQKVSREPDGRVGQEIIQVEQESVDDIFGQGPKEHSSEKATGHLVRGQASVQASVDIEGDDGQPKDRDHIPGSLGEDLQIR
jgi:hypothetical protein